MSEQLKPCPFCGNENPHATHDDYVHDNGQPMPVVECTNCHTWVRAESWGNRVSDTALAARDQRIAELEGLLREGISPGGVDAGHNGRIRAALAGQQQADHSEDVRAMVATPAEDGQEVPLAERMKAAGMKPTAELLAGAPLDVFVAHAGVVDLDTFGQWLVMKRKEYIDMQARFTLDGREDDELYEWVIAHCAVFGEVHINFRNALRAQPARQVGGDEPVGYRSRFLKDSGEWMVNWGRPLPADPNPHAEYQLLYTRTAIAPAAVVDDWEPSAQDYDRAIHHNPDAKAWADLFVATFPRLADKHDLMLGWFANAMMAMHDWLKSQEAAATVVLMPENKKPFTWDINYSDGWNDALNAVARLNRNAIPLALLERIAEREALATGPLFDDARELRALLGKS